MAAAILIADCTVTERHLGELKCYSIVTPATADDTDYIDVSSLFDTYCVSWVSGETDKTYLNQADVWDDLQITLPAGASGTDNQARTIIAMGW